MGEDTSAKEDGQEEVKYCCFLLRMIDTYDIRFLVTLGLSYA